MSQLNMRTFKQEKLWRDKMPAIVKARSGSIIHTKILNDQEFDDELRTKLREEAEEVERATARAELIEELADVYEVIDTLIALHALTKEEIIEAKNKKRDEKGGFSGRTYVVAATHPIGSHSDAYCMAQPEKYPEIKD